MSKSRHNRRPTQLEDKQFEILTKKLDSLSKLLAFNIVAGKSVNDQVDMLTKAGLRATEIADMLGKTENQIYVTQNALRKARKKEAAPEGAPAAEGNANV
jgi:hypothetical protein